ncbi:MAG: hypothetical protein JWO31_2697 [Phycisphaerales bacterium]|nr:hypothetical protein [Phycisphaerales bacterium]
MPTRQHMPRSARRRLPFLLPNNSNGTPSAGASGHSSVVPRLLLGGCLCAALGVWSRSSFGQHHDGEDGDGVDPFAEDARDDGGGYQDPDEQVREVSREAPPLRHRRRLGQLVSAVPEEPLGDGGARQARVRVRAERPHDVVGRRRVRGLKVWMLPNQYVSPGCNPPRGSTGSADRKCRPAITPSSGRLRPCNAPQPPQRRRRSPEAPALAGCALLPRRRCSPHRGAPPH